ncbi:hypothetical protein N9L28_03700 [Luminiphilus sp.]|nr:hypothetical protein [Luminiphilus sp.]
MKTLIATGIALAFATSASAKSGFVEDYWLDANELAAVQSANEASNMDGTLAFIFDVDQGCNPSLVFLLDRAVTVHESREARTSEMQIKVDEKEPHKMITVAFNDFLADSEGHIAEAYDLERLRAEMLDGWKLYLRFKTSDGDDYSPTYIFNLKNYRTASGNAKRTCMKKREAIEEERKSADVW